MNDAERAGEVLTRLRQLHPDARVELDFETPLQLLVATILAAQSTDRRVNLVTPVLFSHYPDAEALAEADNEELQEVIRSTGFFRQKAKNLQACCQMLTEEHAGEVPTDMESLTALPGVGRKTANVVRAVAYGLPGIAVDTHCKRLSNRLQFTGNSDPVKIEGDLGALFPESAWVEVSRMFVWHGRYTCKARTPLCAECNLQDLCPWFREQGRGA